MAMQYDVKATALSGSGVIYAGSARIKAVAFSYSTDEIFRLRDGGVTGTVVLSFTAPDTNGSIYMLLPGEGIRCNSNIFAEFSTGHVTVFYG